MRTKKDLLLALASAPSVRVTMVGGLAMEDWPDTCAKLTALGWVQHGDDSMRSGAPNGSSQYINTPKMKRVRLGVFGSKNARYWFTEAGGEPSFGQVPDLKVVGDALELTMFNGAVLRYEVAV